MHAVLCKGCASHSRVVRESAPPVPGAVPSPGHVRWYARDGHLLLTCQLQLGAVHRYNVILAKRYTNSCIFHIAKFFFTAPFSGKSVGYI